MISIFHLKCSSISSLSILILSVPYDDEVKVVLKVLESLILKSYKLIQKESLLYFQIRPSLEHNNFEITLQERIPSRLPSVSKFFQSNAWIQEKRWK